MASKRAPSTRATSGGIAYDRAGPRYGTTVVLVHAGVADRRMWDPHWTDLVSDHDVVRLDLRGFGESVERPRGTLCHWADVARTLDECGVRRAHLLGASLGAGVAVEVALERPDLVESILLSGPGGSLIPEMTHDLRAFSEAERSALARDDLDAAVDANVAWWVDGPYRDSSDEDGATSEARGRVRERVRMMQRRAFELTMDWDDVEEEDLEPPIVDRLAEVSVPTLVLEGALDLDAIRQAARRVADGVPDVRVVEWPDVAHLPSMERPADFGTLVRAWLDSRESSGDA